MQILFIICVKLIIGASSDFENLCDAKRINQRHSEIYKKYENLLLECSIYKSYDFFPALREDLGGREVGLIKNYMDVIRATLDKFFEFIEDKEPFQEENQKIGVAFDKMYQHVKRVESRLGKIITGAMQAQVEWNTSEGKTINISKKIKAFDDCLISFLNHNEITLEKNDKKFINFINENKKKFLKSILIVEAVISNSDLIF